MTKDLIKHLVMNKEEIDKEKIAKAVVDELSEAMRNYIGSSSYNRIREEDVISVDIEKQEIILKLKFNIVEEDDYIGLATY